MYIERTINAATGEPVTLRKQPSQAIKMKLNQRRNEGQSEETD